ncbi:hypothetical protein AMPC_17450 [Anaeromyxobacter paludicola]|uniref:Lipoprotein n=1 Tax=Anaeromyxobacter paludicola TaxID=2918171 RepID=A0ABN6N9I3_9BACT|nr:hypothetical protein AMPC_17450 [Anaeromyxobacter paludicola]
MRGLALLFFVATACASAPGPKPPDESRRVPVNRTAPPELGSAGNRPQSRERQREGEVEWR